MAREQVAPAFDLGQEGGVHRGGAFLALAGGGVAVESALEDGLFREKPGDLVPARLVVLEGEVEQARLAGAVAGRGLDPAIVDGEFLEVGEDGRLKPADQA
jgi:hypothetical protein